MVVKPGSQIHAEVRGRVAKPEKLRSSLLLGALHYEVDPGLERLPRVKTPPQPNPHGFERHGRQVLANSNLPTYLITGLDTENPNDGTRNNTSMED